MFRLLLLLLLLTACTSLPTPEDRQSHAEALARHQHWSPVRLDGGRFSLLAYVPEYIRPAEHLSIYIEGDGLAWISASRASTDPTPRNPLALKLALAQPEGNAVYLARPCQYQSSNETVDCPQRYWTEERFAPEVIEASNRAVDQLKVRFGAERLTLVGYSGGAAVAALIAARRADVERLITVAGNLDHRAWTTRHRLAPLTGSLNPAADAIPALSRIAQWHFVGDQDRIIPPELVQGFAERFPAGKQPRVIEHGEFDHHCCWAEAWPGLWRSMQ